MLGILLGAFWTLVGAFLLARTYRQMRGVSDYPARLVSAVTVPEEGGRHFECVVDVDVDGKTLRLPMSCEQRRPPGVLRKGRWPNDAEAQRHEPGSRPLEVMPRPPEFRALLIGEEAVMHNWVEQYFLPIPFVLGGLVFVAIGVLEVLGVW